MGLRIDPDAVHLFAAATGQRLSPRPIVQTELAMA
jgi:hypothetical protein